MTINAPLVTHAELMPADLARRAWHAVDNGERTAADTQERQVAVEKPLDLDRDVGERIAAVIDRFFAGTVREHQRLTRRVRSRQ
jgi:hypothetical protein